MHHHHQLTLFSGLRYREPCWTLVVRDISAPINWAVGVGVKISSFLRSNVNRSDWRLLRIFGTANFPWNLFPVRNMMDKVLITASLLLLCTALQVQSQIEIDRNLRIVGGAVARVGQFPHAAALILYLTKSRSSFCGGSIISSRFILTVLVNWKLFPFECK